MSTLEYKPDPGAKPDDHWAVVYLSMRDVSAEVPINHITHPGVHVTQACFSNGIYDDLPTQSCISDLFAGQFRRLIIDLYWDNINRQFNLCPVELPPLVGNSTAGYSVDSSALFSITASTASSLSTPLPTTTLASNATTPLSPTLKKRQSSVTESASSTSDSTSTSLTDASSSTNTSSSVLVNATSSIGSTSTATTDVAIPTSTGASGGTLLQLGPYMCSLDLNIGSVISIYNDYIHSTSDTIAARLHFLDINLHVAAPFTDPSAPAQRPISARLPIGDDLIGAQFQMQLDGSLFTPQALEEDRRNLNKTWFRDEYRVITDTTYFRTEQTGQDGAISTPDGWPGEAWVLLTDSRRLLVSWGDIDPQMAQYDFRTESSNIFNKTDLISSPPIEWDSGGDVTAGCFYHKGETSVTATNASWAMGIINNTDLGALPTLAQNLTACGISPVLNMTIGEGAAPNQIPPYRDFAQSAVFGWAAGEPANASSQKENDDFRCAVLDSNPPYSGHWRVETCQTSRRVACRIAGQPFAWRLSTISVGFGDAPDACPEHTVFGLPRTGLENTYLYRQILNDTSADCDDDCKAIMSGIWINLNSLDQPDCWVIDGPNATCPYSDFQEEQNKRQVLIPTIAAIIILILSVLTLLVKCNQNRRNRRARRRGENGWEYEGIPS